MAITITLFINWILRPAVNNIPPIIQQNTIAVPKSGCANNNPIKDDNLSTIIERKNRYGTFRENTFKR